MKIGSASASSARSRYRIMRSGMGVSDAVKAWVLKRFPGERGAGGASVLSTRGAEAYMSRGLCDYFVTVGSRNRSAAAIRRHKSGSRGDDAFGASVTLALANWAGTPLLPP